MSEKVELSEREKAAMSERLKKLMQLYEARARDPSSPEMQKIIAEPKGLLEEIDKATTINEDDQ